MLAKLRTQTLYTFYFLALLKSCGACKIPNRLFGRLDGAWQKAKKPILGSWGGLETGQKKQITNLIFGVATLPPLPKPPKRPKKQFAKAKTKTRSKLARNPPQTRQNSAPKAYTPSINPKP